ncbi:MAG: hypothetical protein Rubg2KO_06770 [Rubricoccaceae bacterium]
MRCALSLLSCLLVLSGCSLKYSHVLLDDPELNDAMDRRFVKNLPFEIELASPDIAVPGGAVAISLSGYGERFDEEVFENITDFYDEITERDLFKLTHVETSSYSSSVRFLIGREPLFRPYVGVGLERLRVLSVWKVPEYDTSEGRCSGACYSRDNLFMHRSFNPRFMAGVQVSVVMIEYERMTDRGDERYPLDGHRFSVGLRWSLPD